nr:hypothetical protein [Frateuria aurantia]
MSRSIPPTRNIEDQNTFAQPEAISGNKAIQALTGKTPPLLKEGFQRRNPEEILPVICAGYSTLGYSRNQQATLVEDIAHSDSTGIAPALRVHRFTDIPRDRTAYHPGDLVGRIGRLINALGR